MRKRQIIFYFGIGVFLVLSVLIVGSYIVSEHIKKESPGSGDSAPLLTSWATRHTHGTCTYLQARHSH